MASARELKTIKEAKEEFARAQKEKDEKAMAAARLKADTARGYETETKVNAQGKYYQAVRSVEPSNPVLKPLPSAEPKPLTSASFRNATGQTTISAEQQKKNQATALQELQGKDGNVASFARGASLAMLDPFSLRKLTPKGINQAQDEASAKNIFTTQTIKNGRSAFNGMAPLEVQKSQKTYEGLGELAGSMVGVDPVGIGLTKGAQAIGRKAFPKAVAQAIPPTPVKTDFFVNRGGATASDMKALDIPLLNAPAEGATTQLPRTTREAPFTVTRGELTKPDIPVQAPNKPVHLISPQKGIEILKEQTFAKNGDLPKSNFETIPKGEQPRAREVEIPKRTEFGETQQYARTLQESAIVDDTLYKEINDAISQGSFTKPTKSNKSVVDEANVTLESGVDEAVTKFKSVLTAEKQPTSYDIALGNRVLQELQKSGRYDEALNVAIDLSEMLSESGRTLQAARIAKRLSPEGRLMIASRTAQKVSKKTGNKINLSDETIEQISKATTEKEIVEANQKAANEIWNQVPANWVDKVNSWRYMAMLFNPKTHIRNIVGNSIFLPAREFKNLLGAGLEKALIRNGERTKAVLNPVKDKAIMDFAKADFDNVKALLKNEGKLDNNIRTLDAKVFDFKPLEAIRNLNLGALDKEDTWFMKFAYDSSLAQYMKANKLTPDLMVGDTLEKARSYAMNESLKATYRDANALANAISRGKSTLANGKYGALGKAGNIALEGLIPFTKTPLNIIKRGVAYSPANVVRGVVNLGRVKSGKVTATEAIDELASGLSGTALLALGTYLGYNNIVNGKEGEYKDKLYNYNQMLGSQNYSLNIDGNLYTIDWAAPLSMPFFVGVEIANAIKDNNADLATVLDSMTQISDPMVNLSMLKGINDIMTNNFEGIGQTALDVGTGYAGQFNPTVFGQVARTADDTRRSTISTQETSLGRAVEKFGRKQVAKVPGASKNLEPYVDLWGREQKTESLGRRAIENFASPGYFKQEKVTPVDKELQALVGKLDEETVKKILPTSTAYQYTVKGGGETYRLTEKESTAYQKARGQESFKGLEKLFASPDYAKMSDDEKVKAVQDVYSDAHQTAKYQYFASKDLPVTMALSKSRQEKFAEVKSVGITDKEFYNIVTTADADASGRMSKAELSKAARKELLSPKQIQALFVAYYKKD